MVIRTITCHHAFNRGAMLQAYALAQYLKSLGHEVQVMDYSPNYMPGKAKVNFKWVPKRYDYLGIRMLYQLAKYRQHKLTQRRHDALESFYMKYIPVTSKHYNTIDELRNDPPVADLYVAGSDQIWNTSFPNGKDAAFYLDFGSPNRKISYAASFATKELVQGTEAFVKNKLHNFDAISVRELSGLKLLNSLGFEGQLVVDPVFLLTSKQWDLFDGNDDEARDRYILIYDFEPRKSAIKTIAKRLADLYGCKIFTVSSAPSVFSYADKSFLTCSPEKFVRLIKHAQCVISNSFHGTAFSMIYGRDFFVVNRKDGLNARMQDLLERYKLNNRLIDDKVSDEDLVKSINYDGVINQLNDDINESKSFLRKQIELALS